MSNTTNTDFVSTIADAFFAWFHNDILPVCFAIFDILVIVIGLVLNILMLVTFKQRGLFNEVSSYIVFVLIIADFISYAFLLLPNVISALATDWILSNPVCEFHGAMIFLLMFVNFGFVTVLSIERAIKLCKDDEELYERVFESKTVRNIIIIVTWALGVLIGFLPVTGVADIKYDFYHQGCMLDYGASPAFLIIHFLFTVILSIITVIVCYTFIFNVRRKMLIKNRLENAPKAKTRKGRNTINSDISGNCLPTISETEDDAFTSDKKETPQKTNGNEQSNGKAKKNSIRPRTPRRQSLLFEVFSDDEENPAFHLAITYIALWGTIMACYLPYVVVSFYGTFNNGPIWGGCYSITLLIMHTCFVVKPIVYLGHNRHYRQVTKQTIPESMRNRARSVRNSVSGMSETLDDLIFRSNAHTKFRAALSTQKAVLIWKKRMQKNKGIFKLKEERNTSPEQPLQTAEESQQQSSKEDRTKAVGGSTPMVNGRTSVTPSGIMINTTSGSSYIEEQRQKLLGGNDKTVRFEHPKPNLNTSPIPGAVQDLGNV